MTLTVQHNNTVILALLLDHSLQQLCISLVNTNRRAGHDAYSPSTGGQAGGSPGGSMSYIMRLSPNKGGRKSLKLKCKFVFGWYGFESMGHN